MSLPNVTKTAEGPSRALTLVDKLNVSTNSPAAPTASVVEPRLAKGPATESAYELEDERLPSVSSF